jgi:hypothetical protein
MAERTARLGFMHYRDADGRVRDAVAGETIQVHPDDLERFDSLNVLMGHKPDEEKPIPATPELVEEKPKPRRGRPRKTDTGD